jgi:hypothetical protein
MSELKPCPFCGTSEWLEVSPCGSMTTDMPKRPYRVVCEHIEHDSVDGPVAYGSAEAIAAWNRRATPTHPDYAALLATVAKATPGEWTLGDPEMDEKRNARLTELVAYLRDDGWQTIESAPKDGTLFLAWSRKHGFCSMRIVGIRHETWEISPTGLLDPPEPTRWRPLPAPPEQGEG